MDLARALELESTGTQKSREKTFRPIAQVEEKRKEKRSFLKDIVSIQI